MKEKSITGFVPFPSKPLQTKTMMSIEQAAPAPTNYTTTEAVPTGGDWNSTWC